MGQQTTPFPEGDAALPSAFRDTLGAAALLGASVSPQGALPAGQCWGKQESSLIP